jgi:L1 cell adhesion molecule like protein
MTHWPFQVVEKDGSPLIKVNYLGDEKTFSPQEISAMVLTKMKEISEAKLGKTVQKAVVTCVSYSSARPAIYFRVQRPRIL